MNAVGIIFANTYDVDLNELTQKRTLAAVPFAGRYRLIDFTLSNMFPVGKGKPRTYRMVQENYFDQEKP